MKKITVLMVLVCMLLVMNSTVFAMSAKELNDKRWEMQYVLDNTQLVTYDDLANNPRGYLNQVVKFKGTVVGTDVPVCMFEDTQGRHFLLNNMTEYQLRLNTEYTISAIFSGRRQASGGGEITMGFSYEKAHMPYMSEYGL